MNDSKFKLLVINYEYPPIGGGGGVICKDVSEEIVKLGHEVDVVTSLYTGLTEYEVVNGVNIYRVPVLFRNAQNVATLPSMLSYVPRGILKATELITNQKYDVINTHFAIPSGPAGNWLSTKFGIPNVLSIHGGDIYDPSKGLSPHKTPILKSVVRKMLVNADEVVAQSTDTKKNAANFYNLNRDIKIIPLGIKQNTYPSKRRTELGLPENKFIFSTIGRIIRRKNLPALLEVIKEVNQSSPSLLLIMGDGPERVNLEQKVTELGIQESVKFLGKVTDEEKFQYLGASDVYLSTAMHEGFGIVFLEAMECELPVICYDKGGQIDFLKDNQTGFLIPLDDKKMFIEKLSQLLNNKNEISRMGNSNKKYVENFYIRNIAQKYVEIFQDVIQRHKKNNLV